MVAGAAMMDRLVQILMPWRQCARLSAACLSLPAAAWFSLVLATLFSLPVAAELSMTLDRNPVRVNETFTLEVKTDQVDADEPRLDLPDGVELIRRNSVTSRSIINGKVSAERSWRYSLVARRTGEFVFPALRLGPDRAAPLAVTVLAADSKAIASGPRPLQLKAFVDQNAVYPQQQLILTVQLLRNVPIRFAQLSEPQLGNALVQKLGDDRNYESQINGVNYLVIERRYAIFPQQAGELVIDPIRFQGDVSRERQLSLFGAFSETEPVSLQTEPIRVHVKPAAQRKDWLPAQQLTLSDELSGGPYHAGEPMTWTVTIQADGLLPAQLPELKPDTATAWRLYPDQPQDSVQVVAGGVRTIRSQKYALVPTTAGELTVPTLQVPWWRLRDQSAQQASLPIRNVTVTPAAGSASAAVENAAASSPNTNADEAIADPAAAPTPAGQEASAPAATSTATGWLWPGLSTLFAALWLLTLLFWWRSRQRSTRAPGHWRSASTLSTVAATTPSAIHSTTHSTIHSTIHTTTDSTTQSTTQPRTASPAKGDPRALRDACTRHDAHAARAQLLALTGAASLEALAARHNGTTAAAVLELQQALYGPPPQRWQGTALAAALPALLQAPAPARARPSTPELPPLYPVD